MVAPEAVRYILGVISDGIAAVGSGGRYGLGTDPSLRHGVGRPGAAGAERISGDRKPVPDGPIERSTEALGRRASRARRDRPSPGPQGSRRSRNFGPDGHYPGVVPQASRSQI